VNHNVDYAKMTRLWFVFSVFLSATLVYGQGAVDCSQIKSPGCKSFNEMVKSRDPDILDSLSHEAGYVCFRSGEDSFSIMSYFLPDTKEMFAPLHWQATDECTDSINNGTKNKYACTEEEQTGPSLMFTSYKNGVPDYHDRPVLIGYKWIRSKNSGSIRGSSLKVQQSNWSGPDTQTIIIDDTRISISYLDKSVSSATYGFELRKSTGRFVETYKAGDDEKQSPRIVTGRCVELRRVKVGTQAQTR
jgi:hypothetical protein